MSQINEIIATLKKTLKAHGLTYADVAAHLHLSEASVKRLFASKQFSLDRLESVCQMMNMEIVDLISQMKQLKQAPEALTAEQETKLVSDIKLLLVAICVLNHWRFEDILNEYKYTEAELIQLLAKLDKLGIIELLPKNKIKLLVDSNFSWLENGPIKQFFLKHVKSDFFNDQFDKPNELLLSVNGMLSQGSISILQKKLSQIANEFTTLHHEDLKYPLAKREGTCLVIAMRPWELEVFHAYRRI
ncbi:helix-turn-helix transcriptional regulator [Endozoicomonas sp. SM1973]|uniref:Helix-turn-helix transcriptional regulator n=1 Tax=Spartinivicinus marinus TaxID=2994442 RepID=A0A853I6T5_9GAMM|nr:helix-turn-helix transcriptional regulator [Spartinivicinus marinus]MCX4026057.1 helix-turn-helix transcriptional regulator [Spartinivicinus marinus]NYZ69033.1 helix-turn-helix transcriptional regulator [Spartinivicinus marinus]